jgi:hypothetical protein
MIPVTVRRAATQSESPRSQAALGLESAGDDDHEASEADEACEP